MSDEEIIREWKKNARQAAANADTTKAPDNPAGDGALSDKDLDSVAGGSNNAGTESFESIGCCTSIFCKPPGDA